MKKINFDETKSRKFLTGKGFYVALCASIVTVGAAAFFAYNQTADNLSNQLDNSAVSESTSATTPKQWGYEDLTDDVDTPKTDIPKTDVPKTDVPRSETLKPEIVTTPKVETTKKPAEAVQAATQPLVMPLNGDIFNPFSNGELVKSKTLNNWKTHDGIDIQGTLGDQVKSMTAGKILDVRDDPMWGACVIVDHGNNLEGHYYNLSKAVPIKVGQKVNAGTVLGAIGDTAECEIAEVSHLHFGLKKSNEWVDPIALIKPRG